MIALHNKQSYISLQGISPSHFKLGGRGIEKIMVERRDNIENWIWRSLYQVSTCLFLMDLFESVSLQKTLNYD